MHTPTSAGRRQTTATTTTSCTSKIMRPTITAKPQALLLPPPPPSALMSPPGQMMPAPRERAARTAAAAHLQSVPRSVDAAPAVIDTSNLREFLMRPGPQGAMVQCYIQRRKTDLRGCIPRMRST